MTTAGSTTSTTSTTGARPPRRPWWVRTAWVGAVVATALGGVVVGYGVLWLQLFGETPDAEDYTVSAGGYGAAAAVLALAVPAVLGFRGPRWLAFPAGVSAALLGLLALGSASAASGAVRDDRPIDTVWDGVGGVLWAPWTWVLVVLGVRAVVRFLTTTDPDAAGV